MNRITLNTQIGSDGVLNVSLPLGITNANQVVQVTVEPGIKQPSSLDDWQRAIFSTSGQWSGDLQRPEQGDFEDREPLS